MSLTERINQDYITAAKARDEKTVSTLRMIKSALKNESVKLGSIDTELTEPQILAVLNREAKQRREAITQYTDAGRPELADQESAELATIESYLPKPMSDEELEALVNRVIEETGATQKSDMGKVMGALKQQLENPADVSRAAGFINQKLI